MGSPTCSKSPNPMVAALVLCLIFALSFSTAPAATFRCSSGGTCDAVVGYVLPNTTALSRIKDLFNVKNLRSILGANNLPLNTLPNFTLPATTTVRIPFPCVCSNGTGKSNKRPVYTVVSGDSLYHIAAQVFSGLVTFQEIQAANNLSNANLISVGQRLQIPLPCSCDDVDGQNVLHYGHLVAAQSTVDGIAQQFGTSPDTLLRLNGLASPRDLQANSTLDVPLRACTSVVRNDSLDNPLLVANGTYVFTATNCVMCNCDAANNWTLHCQPTQIRSSLWSSCPSVQCQGAEMLSIGNSTSLGCNRTSCAYAGYTNRTILTTLVSESTCPAPSNDNSSAIGLQSWGWNTIWIFFHIFFCLHKFV